MSEREGPSITAKIRDHFAGLAMQALIARTPYGISATDQTNDRAAKIAFDIADAMIAERKLRQFL